MDKFSRICLIGALAAVMLFTGCVERRLTINTVPQGATVALNDEEVGQSPVTVNFNWYGDYRIRISKEGYDTLNTHRTLKGPWYDHFPYDFFAQVVTPKQIVNSYDWSFDLSPHQKPDRDQLIKDAMEFQELPR